ncbi:unnamed protein product, partial [marine sediment metagenome]
SKIKERINGKTILISVGYANNEIGTIQKISGIGKLCKEYNIVFHSDAVAAAEEDLKRFAKRTGHKVIKFEKNREIKGFNVVEKVLIHDLNEDNEYELFIDSIISLEIVAL